MTSPRYHPTSLNYIYENQTSYRNNQEKVQSYTPKAVFSNYYSPKAYTTPNFISFTSTQNQPIIQQAPQNQIPSSPTIQSYKNRISLIPKPKIQNKDIQIFKRFLLIAVNKKWNQTKVNQNWNQFVVFLGKQTKEKQQIETYFDKIQKKKNSKRPKSSHPKFLNIKAPVEPQPYKAPLQKMLTYNQKYDFNKIPIKKSTKRSTSLDGKKQILPINPSKKVAQANPLLKFAQQIQTKLQEGDKLLIKK